MKKSTPAKSVKKTAPKESAPELIIPNIQVKLVIPLKDAQASYAKNLKKLAPGVKAEGFRKGKVPTHIAEGLIGKVNIIDRTLQELVPAIYMAQIKKLKKEPLTNPDIKPLKITMEADWELVAEIAEKPEFKLGNYKKVAKAALKEGEKEVKAEEKKTHDHSAELKKGEKADKGHKVNGKAREGTLGHKGKHTHKLTDKQKEDIKLSHVFKALVQEIKPQIHELLLREKVRSELHRLEGDLKHINTTLDDYLKKQKTTFEQFTQQMAVMHLGQAQLEFILRDITEVEKIEATPAEITAKIKEVTAKLKLAETPEGKSASKDFDKSKYTPYITNVINREKVTHFLLNL
jgi:FKBP-type peptidyl-prolyl cis-trans isomerase (trigger factor)